MSGEQCARNQIEPKMWFLAGTFGKVVKRTCLIPSNRAILIPIINPVHLLSESLSFKSDSDLESKVRNEANNVTEMNLTIDGLQLSELKKYRIHTSAFDVIIPDDNIWGVKPGKTRAAGDDLYRYIAVAEQELVEAYALKSVMEDRPLPSMKELEVTGESYLTGLLDCVGEIKPPVYDRMRSRNAKDTEKLFATMEETYNAIHPFAVYDNIVSGLQEA